MARSVDRFGVVITAVLIACATPRPVAPDPARLAAADAELLRGCYDCLLAARTAYRALAAGEASRARLFEVDLLLVLRERELGLPSSDALPEARRLAGELPARLAAPRYLAIADTIAPSALASSGRERRALHAAHDDAARHAQMAWLPTGPLRAALGDYLRIALACGDPDQPPAVGPAPPAASAPPLLAYRAAICGSGPMDALAEIRRREPRFVETSLVIASTELTLAPHDGPGHARDHLAEVVARFPASTAAAYLTGSYLQLVGDYAGALGWFDRTLARRPDHDAALLGRIICLERLGRNQDVIDGATRLLALGGPARGDALYWRARGHLGLRELAEARRDITEAKEWAGSSDVLSLSGRIAFEQDDLEPARRDLTDAVAGMPGDCTARWYLALVERRAERWLDAGGAFRAAMTCFAERATASRALAARWRDRADVDADYRAVVVAGLTASADADVQEQHRAALVGASCFASGGDPATARGLLDTAAEDPTLAVQVAHLRAQLAAPRPKSRGRR